MIYEIGDKESWTQPNGKNNEHRTWNKWKWSTFPWRILPCSWVRCSAAVNTNHKHICQSHQCEPYMMLLTSLKCVSLSIIRNQLALYWQLKLHYKLVHMGIVYNWVNYYLVSLCSHNLLPNYIYFDVLQSLLDRCFVWHNHNYRAGQKLCL